MSNESQDNAFEPRNRSMEKKKHAIPECRELHHWLEEAFNPLQLCKQVEKTLAVLREHEKYSQYVKYLEDVTVVRLFQHVAEVYETIELDRLARLIPFARYFRLDSLERTLVHIAKDLGMQIRVDQCSRSLRFGSELSVVRENVLLEGAQIQIMSLDMIKIQLMQVSQSLQKAIRVINLQLCKDAKENERLASVHAYKHTALREHHQMLERKRLIEQQLLMMQHRNMEKERQAKELVEEQRLKAEEMERETETRNRNKSSSRNEEHRGIPEGGRWRRRSKTRWK